MYRGSETALQRKPDIGVLHGFRALMVLFVANYHIWQQSWLAQKVTLFGRTVGFDFFTRSSYVFVDGMILLSGFLLFLPYARQMRSGTPVDSVKTFYRKRFVRIVPSYLAAVLGMLLLVALPQGLYRTAQQGAKDVLTHLTFTFTFWRDTYLHTQLNVGLWTIAIEMQFYLLFPLLARMVQRRPALTLGGMAALGVLYRFAVARLATDTGILINQMPAFLDVYALGMLGAMIYVRLPQRTGWPLVGRLALGAGCTALVVLGWNGVLQVLRVQSTASTLGLDALRLSQMEVRLPLVVLLLVMMLAATQAPRVLQKLLDNRLMRFLAGISMNLYIWHQVLAVEMRKAWFANADALHADPAMQAAYTALCCSVALLAAMAFTFGVERPASKALMKAFDRMDRSLVKKG